MKGSIRTNCEISSKNPFLGELAKDPSARGLFDALSLLGTGVEQGQVNLAPYRTALAGFHDAMTSALAGHPHPLSWVRLLGGALADRALSAQSVASSSA